MATSAIKFTGETAFTGTHTAGQKVYWRSTDVDDDQFFNVFGTNTSDVVADHHANVGNTSNGTVEHLSSIAFNTVAIFECETAVAQGTISLFSNDGTAATGTIHIHAQPSNTDTLIIGPVGFETTYTWVTAAASSAGQVQTVADLSICAENLASAINDATTGPSVPAEGTGWTSTAADTYLSATVSGNTVTVTDRINCKKALGWTTTPTDTADVVISGPSGGVDGTAIGTITIGDNTAGTATGLEMSTGDLSTLTLPPNLELFSNAVRTRGKFAINVRSDDPAGQTSLVIQLSNDGTNWWNAPTTTITDLDTTQLQYLVGDDLFAEYSRISITDNDGNGCNLDCVYVY